jgi:hypothetical protein
VSRRERSDAFRDSVQRGHAPFVAIDEGEEPRSRYFAGHSGGNGSQLVIGIPELDLLVAFYVGNYSDPVRYRIQEEFVPDHILPAVSRIEE